MECRNCINKIPEYLTGNLSTGDFTIIKDHLDHCPLCREQLKAFAEIDRMINIADVEIPEIDLTAEIIGKVKQETQLRNEARQRKKTWSMFQDLVAAAAAAIIIFWVSSPILAQYRIPSYTREVVDVSKKVGGVVQSYMDLYGYAEKKLSDSINQIGPAHEKGDE